MILASKQPSLCLNDKIKYLKKTNSKNLDDGSPPHVLQYNLSGLKMNDVET